jgi:hypothetical protein
MPNRGIEQTAAFGDRSSCRECSPETLSFTPNTSFLACAPGLVCPDPGKMPEKTSFSPDFACFDLALRCIILLNRLVLVRKDFAQDALKSKSQCNPAKTA